ncbi:DUF4268 domain-containing protein [Siccirubricoccus phaeus]|uniref:DUF4268 domain-containing protein n=1 Tax=Siccirubricoccus phaeus TaxID=2595053 RepID=UPI00165A7383|nr:DUF4268 domain-containing protein [Siccirubricoccus phaeus]
MVAVTLGKLENIDPRQLWPMEAKDFTPWLAGNLGLLGEALGLDLELVRMEAPVGSFACDIEARDTGSGRRVIIENQLSETDHGHLGQLITYAAGLEAGVVVWIAPKVREEHREAIDFLNRHTRETVDFFMIALEVISISGSPPAVVFRLAASPNAWAKTAAASASKTLTDKTVAYQEFYQGLMDELREKHKFTNAKAAQPQSWYAFSSGTTGISYSTAFASGNRLRVELYIDVGDMTKNKAIFDALKAQEQQIEKEIAEPLTWERLDARRASRISVVRENTSIADASTHEEEIRDWVVKRLLKFKAVFGPRLKAALAATPPQSANVGVAAA